jgi:TldD protein
MVFFGSSPLRDGTRVASESVSVADTVRPGSWAARAYDAEGRPTHPVTLVDDGTVVNLLHDTVSAADVDTTPSGHVIPSLGHEHPPRIHARHLDVEPGEADVETLQQGATAYVERLGAPVHDHEATRSKRQSSMPPSVQYAKHVDEGTPDAYDGEADDQRVAFPVELGYELVDGERADVLVDATLVVDVDDFQALDGLGVRRETVTGTCTKHESRLPFEVTAPAVRLPGTIR